MNIRRWRAPLALMLALALAPSFPAQTKDAAKNKKAKRAARAEASIDLPAVLTHDAGDLAALDLVYGEGGKENAPDPNGTYTFVDEDLNQSQPKIDVTDEKGRTWRVKMGAESRAETAATRLVWAAGYFVDEDYFLPEIKVQGLPGRLHRGQQYVSPGGVVRGVRLELKPKSVKKLAYWKWSKNPFAGTRELNGLRVMMALIDNWDSITRNNDVFEWDGQRKYVVSDLGASFGRPGSKLTRSKGKMNDYAKARFIAKTTSTTVDFAMRAWPVPAFLSSPFYGDLAESQGVYKRIPRADARWIGERLARLSDSQIRDCFAAAGYSTEEADGYTAAIRERIRQLSAL